MAAENTHQLEIEVTGAVSPSLAAAAGLSERQLARLSEASKVMNSIITKQTKEAFRGIEKESHEAAEKVKENFERMREAGERAMEKIHEKTEKLFDKLKEFSGISALFGAITSGAAAFGVAELSKEGVGIYNARLKLMERQAAILRAQGRGGMAGELQEQIERREGVTGFGYEQQIAAMTKIAGARPGLGAEKIADITQQLEDLAGTPEKLDAVVTSFTGVFVKGGLSPKALKGFFEATGLNLRIELAKTFGVTPDEMQKLMGKKGLAPSQLIAGLEKTLDRLTKIGGAFHGRAQAFLQTFEGIQLRWGYLWENFASGWGKTVENLITPIANEFLAIFTNERINEAFINVQAWATRTGAAVTFLVQQIRKSGVEAEFQKIGQAISKLFGGLDLNLFFKDVDIRGTMTRVLTATGKFWIEGFKDNLEKVRETIEKLHEVTDYIGAHWKDVLHITEAIVALWAAERVALAATTFGNFAKMFGMGAIGAGIGGGLGALASSVAAAGYGAMLMKSGGEYMKTDEGKLMRDRAEEARFHAGKTEVEHQANIEAVQKSEAIKQNIQEAKKSSDQIADAFQKITNLADQAYISSQLPGGGMMSSPGLGTVGGAPGGAAAPVAAGPAFPGALRAMAYGPSQGEHTYSTTHGNFGQLQPGDLALSPDMLSSFPMGSYVDVVDAHGKILRAHRRVADTSWIKPGVPTHHSFELWNDQDLGNARLVAAQHAAGGFVGSKTLSWLGERGPEAVIPLNRSAGSLALLERTAAALGARASGGHQISISMPLTVHASGGANSEDFVTALREHAESVVAEIKRTLAIETERMAAI